MPRHTEDNVAEKLRKAQERQKAAFDAIVNERRWQDQNIKHFKDERNEHSVAEYALMIQHAASLACGAYSTDGEQGALDQIRQIAALCVRAMEECGVADRTW